MVRVGYKVLYTKVVTLISLLFLQWVPKVCYVYLDSEAGAGRHALGEVRHHAAALCNQHTLDIQISGSHARPPWYCGCAASAGWSAHCASLQHRAPALQSALQCCGLTAAGSSSVTTITTTVHLMLVLLLSRSVND